MAKKPTFITEAEKDTFAEVMAHTGSAQKAMIAAQPDLITRKNYANVKGHRLIKRPDIQEKMQKSLEKMSKPAMKRIQEMIQSEDESIASQNAWKVVEHIRGKPIAKNLNMNAKVNIEDALFGEAS